MQISDKTGGKRFTLNQTGFIMYDVSTGSLCPLFVDVTKIFLLQMFVVRLLSMKTENSEY